MSLVFKRCLDPVLSSRRVVLLGQKLRENFSSVRLPEGLRDRLEKAGRFAMGEHDISVVPVSTEASRHNSPFRHDDAVKGLEKALAASGGKSEAVQIVCSIPEKKALLAFTQAIAKASPALYDRRSKPKGSVLITADIVASEVKESEIEVAQLVAENTRTVQMWTDMAPNELTPGNFVEVIRQEIQELGVEMKVISGTDLREQGFGGIWNVGKAAESLPALVHLSFGASKNKQKTAVLLGKGICYDSGGLTLKPKDSMVGMKRDMGGAAACLGGFLAVVKAVNSGRATLAGEFDRIDCILCIAENSISSKSFRNDDIITLYSGLTVEVNNTDAEGRLLLADGAAYAVKHIPGVSQIVDFATLTGAATYAGGHLHGSLMSNSEILENQLVQAGKISGDLVFPMLYLPERHGQHLKSEHADLVNAPTVKDDVPSSCAGYFIEQSLRVCDYKGDWAHVDMARPVMQGKRSSGYGVGLIAAHFLAFL